MNRMYAVFVPLLAIVAFATMSSAAQAAPIWLHCVPKVGGDYTNSWCNTLGPPNEYEWEAVGPELEALEVVTHFASLSLHANNGVVITCEGWDEGLVWNDYTGGIPTQGLDEITAFVNKSCASEQCPEGPTVTAEGLPWDSELVSEVVEGKTIVRDKITGIEIRATCADPSFDLLFTGELSPEMNTANGTAEFNASAGSLSAGGGLTATVSGNDTLRGKAHDAISIDP